MTETIKYRFGFRGKKQLPLFMVWKEYWVDGKVEFAKVLFMMGCPR